MKFLFAAAALSFIQAFSYPEILTNSVITPLKPVTSYKIVEFYLKSDPSIMITREFTSGNSGIMYYFINMDTLRYGVTGDWRKEDFTDSPPGKETKFKSLLKLQASRGRPFGSSEEVFPPGNFTNIVLTSDLCPTSKRFARVFYDGLKKYAITAGREVPVVIFFSGRWIERHPQDLSAIKQYPVNFIAGNHTYSHPINRGGYLKEFLISEVTNTERLMLENGILPSYLFRFPGLSHTPQDIACLNSINMIPLDANVWMGDNISNWNVLLVHSNGNAISEVDFFINFLENPGKIHFSDVFSFMELTLSRH